MGTYRDFNQSAQTYRILFTACGQAAAVDGLVLPVGHNAVDFLAQMLGRVTIKTKILYRPSTVARK